MELQEARRVRDEANNVAKSLLRGRIAPRSVLLESGERIEGPARPLKVAMGIAVGEGEGDYGLAVRTTAPREFIEQRLLPELEAQADRIDVRFLTYIRSRSHRPPRIGSSIGHPAVTVGTLGAFARDRQSGRDGLVSNNHVLAYTNRAVRGDDVWCPGRTDGGRPADAFGRLERYVALGPTNEVDAAFALLSEPLPATPGEVGAGIHLSGRTIDPTRRLPVVKNGRTTGLTRGVISAIEVNDVEMDYGSMMCSFDNQIEVTSPINSPFSAGGDSGSLVVTPEGDAVGLLFGGGPTDDNRSDLTFINPIDRVLAALDIELVY